MDDFTAAAALADPVRLRLFRYVTAQRDAVGREEAAEGAGVPLHTARFQLERLVAEGLLETGFRRLSGRTGPGAGRPAKVYRRTTTEISVQVPGRSYDLVGSVLAAAVARSLSGEPLPAALAAEARDHGRAAGSSYDGKGKGVDRAVGVLAAEGYEPAPDDDGTVIMRNCPFDVIAREQPALVCGISRDFVGGALEGLGCSGLEAQLDPGPDRCCVRIAQDSSSRASSRS